MRLVVLGVIVLAFGASRAEAQDAQRPTVRFQPRVSAQTAPPPALYSTASQPNRTAQAVNVIRHYATAPKSRTNDTQVICGMTVIRKTPEADPKIVIKPERAGSAVRRIEPNVCTNPNLER